MSLDGLRHAFVSYLHCIFLAACLKRADSTLNTTQYYIPNTIVWSNLGTFRLYSEGFKAWTDRYYAILRLF